MKRAAHFTKNELRRALRHVAHSDAAGIDGDIGACYRESAGVAAEDAKARASKLVNQIHRELARGTYHFKPVVGRVIRYPSGKTRELAIPTLRDRVVLRAAATALADAWGEIPMCVRGGRPGASVGEVAREATNLLRARPWHILKIDIRRAFPSTPRRDALLALRAITDRQDLVDLLDDFYSAQGERIEGLGQGVAVAPLLLASLLKTHVVPVLLPACDHLFLWVDDALIFVRDANQALVARAALAVQLRDLGMELHPQKMQMVGPCTVLPSSPINELRFLGWAWLTRYPVASPEAELLLAERVTACLEDGSVELAESVIRSWAAAFATPGEACRMVFEHADELIRGRIAEIEGGSHPKLPRLVELLPGAVGPAHDERRASLVGVGPPDIGNPALWQGWASSLS